MHIGFHRLGSLLLLLGADEGVPLGEADGDIAHAVLGVGLDCSKNRRQF